MSLMSPWLCVVVGIGIEARTDERIKTKIGVVTRAGKTRGLVVVGPITPVG